MTKRVEEENFKQLGERLKREDEDRWLSSRYAPSKPRRQLVALYVLNLELAKVRTIVSEPGLGAIRFQWWREATAEIQEADKTPRQHDVVQAVATAGLAEKVVLGLIDGHEAAFEKEDRALEPEALLMRAAAGLLAPAHAWGEHILALAPAYAAARRGTASHSGPALPDAPKLLRPALGHAALRFAYVEGKRPGPLRKRMIVMKAMSSGRV